MARDRRHRARAAVLHRLRPTTMWRALARRLAVRRARRLARAGCDPATIARRTGLSEDLVRLMARGIRV